MICCSAIFARLLCNSFIYSFSISTASTPVRRLESMNECMNHRVRVSANILCIDFACSSPTNISTILPPNVAANIICWNVEILQSYLYMRSNIEEFISHIRIRLETQDVMRYVASHTFYICVVYYINKFVTHPSIGWLAENPQILTRLDNNDGIIPFFFRILHFGRTTNA